MAFSIVPERRRWLIILVIFLAIVFNYFDRQIVSILKPVLKDHFDLDDSGYAVIINVFTIFYALMYPVSGWLVDKFGSGKVMLIGIIGWSVACIGGVFQELLGSLHFLERCWALQNPLISQPSCV